MITVVLTGECADEIFGGYPWFHKKECFDAHTFPWSMDISARQEVDVASAYTSVEDAIKALEKIPEGTTEEPGKDTENTTSATDSKETSTKTEASSDKTTTLKTQVSSSNPKTGDSNTWFVVSTLTAIASAAGIVLLKVKGKKEEANE